MIIAWILFFIFYTFSYAYGKDNNEADLIVRTINVQYPGSEYPLRLRGIAQAFHRDYPHQIGLIGLQELGEETLTGCLQGNTYNNGAECLAAELNALYMQKAKARISERTWYQKGREVLGIIVDEKWKIIDMKSWDIGYNRMLMEAFLEHKTKGYRLRFYNTHFSSNAELKWYEKFWYGFNSNKDKGQKKRNRLAEKVINIVRERAKPGELPPVIVGDFNAGRNFVSDEAELSVQKLESHFWRMIDDFRSFCTDYTVVDNVYIGKKKSFPNSLGYFQLKKWHRIRMHKKPVIVDGHELDQLTDHNAEGFSFDILTKLPKSSQKNNRYFQ